MPFVWLVILLLVGLMAVIWWEERHLHRRLQRGLLTEVWDGPDRRRATRLKLALEVRYRLIASSGNGTNGHTINISSGGMCASMIERLSERTELRFEILLPIGRESAAIRGRGEVVWVKEGSRHPRQPDQRTFITGIRFVELDPAAKQVLLAFLEEPVKARSGVI